MPLPEHQFLLRVTGPLHPDGALYSLAHERNPDGGRPVSRTVGTLDEARTCARYVRPHYPDHTYTIEYTGEGTPFILRNHVDDGFRNPSNYDVFTRDGNVRIGSIERQRNNNLNGGRWYWRSWLGGGHASHNVFRLRREAAWDVYNCWLNERRTTTQPGTAPTVPEPEPESVVCDHCHERTEDYQRFDGLVYCDDCAGDRLRYCDQCSRRYDHEDDSYCGDDGCYCSERCLDRAEAYDDDDDYDEDSPDNPHEHRRLCSTCQTYDDYLDLIQEEFVCKHVAEERISAKVPVLVPA